jgi:hypothetical protein
MAAWGCSRGQRAVVLGNTRENGEGPVASLDKAAQAYKRLRSSATAIADRGIPHSSPIAASRSARGREEGGGGVLTEESDWRLGMCR